MNRETLIYVFPNGRCFPKWLVDSLKEQISEQVSLLMPGTEYTLRQICGEEFWLCLDPDKHEPNTAGACVVQLAKHGLVPLHDTRKTDSANAHLYLVT